MLGLWAVIEPGGSIDFAAATLPPIQSLEVSKQPSMVERVGLDGKPLTTQAVFTAMTDLGFVNRGAQHLQNPQNWYQRGF